MGYLKLKKDAPFEEISKAWYKSIYEDATPHKTSPHPFEHKGWFIAGEPYLLNDGEPCYLICLYYKCKYYIACRSMMTTQNADIEKEISNFFRERR